MRPFLLLSVILTVCMALSAPALAQVDDSAARKQKILANLQLIYPQLQGDTVEMGSITASGYGSLDQGSLTVNGVLQNYLVASNDTELYMITTPIDVSRDAQQLAAAVAEREAEAQAAAAARNVQLRALARALPFRGSKDAPVLIVEFGDFECPFCAQATETVEAILEKYPDDVKLVFMHLPLDFHPWAKTAAIAAECAATQNADAFWILHDAFFANQAALNDGNVIAAAAGYLSGARVDMKQWTECATDAGSASYAKAAAAVAASKEAGSELGISGTPGFFVNGIAVGGAQPIEAFEPLIEAAKRSATRD